MLKYKGKIITRQKKQYVRYKIGPLPLPEHPPIKKRGHKQRKGLLLKFPALCSQEQTSEVKNGYMKPSGVEAQSFFET